MAGRIFFHGDHLAEEERLSLDPVNIIVLSLTAVSIENTQ